VKPLDRESRQTSVAAAPKVAQRWRKRTKQLATLGPASSTFEMIETLFLAGADIFRLNFSHGSQEQKKELLNKTRITYDGIIEKLGNQKEQPCLSTFKVGRSGFRSKGIACPKNKIAEAISSQKDAAKLAVDAAGIELAQANEVRSKMFDDKFAAQLSLAEKEVKSALFSSQLHSFTGMFYGKDVTHVSDDEVYAFIMHTYQHPIEL
jgi:hypothetical protein